jgi:DNA replication protein DnaC
METTVQTTKIAEVFSAINLKHFARALEADFASMPEEEKITVSKYLLKWGEQERSERRSSQIASRIRSARFRRLQTVEAFDFKHSATTEKIERQYLALLSGLSRDQLPSAVFTGNAGVGKTHLARALGYSACQKGLSTLFVTAAEMVNQLGHASKTYTLESELNRYRRPLVLIIDELGYVSLDAQASNLFFQVISARHDSGYGTIATTNLPFGKFNQIFANDAIAHAIVDRLVNEAEVFFMEGESYRQHQRKQKTKGKG